MYGIVSDIFMTRPYSFFFSICPEYKIQGPVSVSVSVYVSVSVCVSVCLSLSVSVSVDSVYAWVLFRYFCYIV